MNDTPQEQPKHPGGRPLKFKTVEELQRKIDAYFGECDPHMIKAQVQIKKADGTFYWGEEERISEQRPYTVSGLAAALGIRRDTLIDYKERDEFSDSINAAYEKCHRYAEEQLYGRAASGAAFSLKNNWGWRDKSEVDHTTDGNPLPAVVRIIDERQPSRDPDTTGV